jgi:hypothetical protein
MPLVVGWPKDQTLLTGEDTGDRTNLVVLEHKRDWKVQNLEASRLQTNAIRVGKGASCPFPFWLALLIVFGETEADIGVENPTEDILILRVEGAHAVLKPFIDEQVQCCVRVAPVDGSPEGFDEVQESGGGGGWRGLCERQRSAPQQSQTTHQRR